MTTSDRTGSAGQFLFERRGFLGAVPLLAVPGLAAAAEPRSSGRSPRSSERVTTPANAIVETGSGKVRGYVEGEIYTFKGIPYAASTEGTARFAPPRPPEPWTGVRNTMVFGPICPQVDYKGTASKGPDFLAMKQFEYPHEDCLKLNVWTPAINDGHKRPVMVWFHGGAFLNGSANRPQTWGKNLARRGDVVVVTVNHRLNVLGFLDLGAFGERYQDSANAGTLDMVAALRWVRDNIAGFGGDPNCVTIFGQSGGGAKVATLLASPPARGLFHRAVVQSSSSRISNADQAERLSARFLERLGITKANVSQLYDIPVDLLVRIGAEVSAAPLNPGDDWRPKVDGRTVLQQPFEPGAPALSADVPVMIGGTRHEFAPGVDVGFISEAQLMASLGKRLGPAKAAELRAWFARAYPGISTNEILALINVQPYRANHLKNAGRLAQRRVAPAYYYIFAWKSPMLDGLPLAYHGAELPFIFGNIAECAPLTGNSPQAYALSAQLCDAWVAFARTGNPNHRGLAKWSPFDPVQGNTMIFDSTSRMINRPWQEETQAVANAGGGDEKPSSETLMRS